MKTARPLNRSTGVVGIAAALLALSACGGSSLGGSAVPADAFAGDWSFTSGSIMPMCSANVSDIALQGNAATITKTDASHIKLLIATADVMCNVMFSVSGSTATIEAAQTCMINADNQSATVDITTWTLTSSAAGISMSMAGTANVVIITCNPTATGMMVKVGGADAAAGG
jgi:hypothetical protein